MDFKTAFERVARHRALVLTVLFIGSGIIAAVVVRTPPRYVASATILMVAEPVDQQSRQVPSSATKPVLASDLPALVLSTNVLSRTAQRMHSTIALPDLGKQIRAKVDTNSNIMPIQFTGRSASEAVGGANAVADAVVDYYRDIATKRFDSLARDLTRQLGDLRTTLQADDEALAAAATSYPYIDIKPAGDASASEGESVYSRLIALERSRDDANAAAAGSAALAATAGRMLQSVIPLARGELGERDPRYRAMRDQYAKDLAQFEITRDRYSNAFPGLPELDSIVSRERGSVSRARAVVDRTPLAESPSYSQVLTETTRARAAAANDRAKLATIDAEINQLSKDLADGSSIGARVSRLRRDREAASQTYAVLSERLASTTADRAQAAATGSVVVADRATFAKRSVLSAWTAVAICLGFLVLWVAFGLPYFLESIDRRFRDRGAIEALYGIPVVGSVK